MFLYIKIADKTIEKYKYYMHTNFRQHAAFKFIENNYQINNPKWCYSA